MSKEREMESGEKSIYPITHDDENSQLRWSFVRKVYSIIIFQLLLTIVVVSVLVFVPPVANFVNNYVPEYVLFIVVGFAFFLVEDYHQKHRLSYFLLLIFTVSLALYVGLICALPSGKIIVEVVTLTTAVVICLSLYTFWAVKRGYDFIYLGSYLFRALVVLVLINLIILIKILFPREKLTIMMDACFFMIYMCLVSILCCGYIIYDTYNIIKKRFSYAQYISVSLFLYKDFIFIFLTLLANFSIAKWIKEKNVVLLIKDNKNTKKKLVEFVFNLK